ncbi:MAG TPA: diguanylate cyclase [Shinella sp.]|jgi:diguanylate cyclase (GGDEF)-like protein|uniref:diguanylate cyclase domain-containing protein n=1 Tax=Shinella sp. TaxID=1870904 RepID=UPI002E13798C|nr:diguanylate cyclase [Shinella sp.]
MTGKAEESRATRRRGVGMAIRAAAMMIVLLFGAANYLVLDHAIERADSFVVETERTLVRNEFSHQIDQVVQYQSQLSFWDKSFNELANGMPGDAFVRDQLRDWMWSDFGFSWMIFASPDGEKVLGVYRGDKVSESKAREKLHWVSDLTRKAERKYRDALSPDRGGWQVARAKEDPDLLTPALPEIHVTGMRLIDRVMSIVVVQAVIPKSLYIPAHRLEPTLLITVKPVSHKMLANAERRLGVHDLGFTPIVTQEPGLVMTPVGADAYNPMVASWRPNMPGSFVWRSALPQIAMFVLVFAGVMLFVTLRFSALVRALQRSEAKNAFLAQHDTLTGLKNRSGFDEEVRRAIRKGENKPFAILALDLDKFKAVNDRHGHAAGDAVLQAVARRFSDRIGKEGCVARLGGDEFSVLLTGERSCEALLELAGSLVRDTQVPIAYDGQLLVIGGSAGIAQFPQHGGSVHDVMVMADAALYAAKNAGRNRAVHADHVSRDIVIEAGEAHAA